jgi:hypothetical protein
VVTELLKMGVITEAGTAYSFASSIHQWLYLTQRYIKPINYEYLPRFSIEDFVIETIKRMKQSTLWSCLSKSKPNKDGHSPLYERMWHMEFYHAASSLIGMILCEKIKSLKTDCDYCRSPSRSFVTERVWDLNFLDNI